MENSNINKCKKNTGAPKQTKGAKSSKTRSDKISEDITFFPCSCTVVVLVRSSSTSTEIIKQKLIEQGDHKLSIESDLTE